MKFSTTAAQSPTQMLPLWWLYEGGPCFTPSTSSSLVCSSHPWLCWSSCSLPTQERRSAWVRTNKRAWRGTGLTDVFFSSKRVWIWENRGRKIYFLGFFSISLTICLSILLEKPSVSYAKLWTVSRGLKVREEESERSQSPIRQRDNETKRVKSNEFSYKCKKDRW